MIKERILVIEDRISTLIFLESLFKSHGYQVELARNGAEGLAAAEQKNPDLIILDLLLPDLDGLEVCETLKSDDKTKDIPIIILTARAEGAIRKNGKFFKGADEFLTKPFDNEELLLAAKKWLKAKRRPPFTAASQECTYSLTCIIDSQIKIENTCNGLSLESKKPFSVKMSSCELSIETVYQASLSNWKAHAKEFGQKLFNEIIETHPKVLESFTEARSSNFYKNFRIRFKTSRQQLRLPFEFMFNEIQDNGDFIVLNYPMARSLTGIGMKKGLINPHWFNDLFNQQLPIEILLIASNTSPSIPGTDQEIAQVKDCLEKSFEAKKISVNINVIPTEEASYHTVKRILKNCAYHVIHYAGHGLFNPKSTEESALFFWEQTNKKGEVKEMYASELSILLKNSETRFVYLSCCQGTSSGTAPQPLNDDFWGIADALIHAGIPSVLGYRWPVSDKSALKSALAFYESLADQGHLDTALLHARQEVAGSNRKDITWLSPILIMQH